MNFQTLQVEALDAQFSQRLTFSGGLITGGYINAWFGVVGNNYTIQESSMQWNGFAQLNAVQFTCTPTSDVTVAYTAAQVAVTAYLAATYPNY